MFRQKLTEMMRAGYSGIAVVTTEVDRCEVEIMRAAAKAGRGFRRWTCTQGWLEWKSTANGDDGAFLDGSGGTDGSPSDGPTGVSEVAAGPNNSVYLMHVFPELFREATVRQLFRDVLGPARASRKTIILVGSFEIPSDLDKEFSGLEFELPEREDLEQIARNLLEDTEVEAPENGEFGRVVDAALGLTELEAQNAYALSLVREKKLDVQTVIETKKEIVRRSGILTYMESEESLDTVGGLEELKGWLVSRSEGFGKKAREFGLAPPRGMMLAGVPGCGKSLVAKATSAAWGLPLLFLDMGRVFGSLVGQSEQQLRSALKVAEALAPCILFIDEFEKAVAGTGGSSSDGGTTQRVMGSFLTWMQDRPTDKPVFVVATANNVSLLPPEMLRKGRWDEVWVVGLPTKEERVEIVKVHLAKVKRLDLFTSEQIEGVAGDTEGFTGSEIEEAVKDGLWRAFGDGEDLSVRHLKEAVSAVIPLSKGPMAPSIAAMAEDNRFRKANGVEAKAAGKGKRLIET